MNDARNALVVGAGSGIGAAMVDELLARDYRVAALVRRPVSSIDVRVDWLVADIADDAGLERALDQVPERLDAMVIASGVLHDADAAPEKAIGHWHTPTAQRILSINALGPLRVLQLALPRLTHPDRSIALVLSAQVGSITDNALGGWYAYRMSKAALNMGIKTAAIEIARQPRAPILAAVHPGTTRSSLSAPYLRRRRACVDARTTARRIGDLVEGLAPTAHGRFLKWDGSELPW